MAKSKKLLLELLEKEYSKRAREKEKYDWDANARPEQRLPDGDWKIWLILAGRGFGKTRTGAESIRRLVEQGYRRVCLLGATDMDVYNVMLNGKSGLMNVHPSKPKFSKNNVYWDGGATALVASGCAYERLRGPEFDCAWVDELAKFPDPQAAFDQLQLALRLPGPECKPPRLIITTTPKPFALLKRLIEHPDVRVTYGSTFDNKQNLAPEYLEAVQQAFGGSRFGAQELHGQIVDYSDSSFCKSITYTHNTNYVRAIIAVDPAATDSRDETGIVVCGVQQDGRFIVLEDASCRMSPSTWSAKAVELYHKYNADAIVAEVNQGGDMVETLIRQEDQHIVYKKVYATKGKMARAQPIAGLYDQGRVVHAGRFSELEEQMLAVTHSHSPDRLDALVWGLTHLSKEEYSDSFIFAI